MNEPFETFTCAACGEGTVRLRAVSGRRMLYRNFPALPLPENLQIPACDACGEEWLDDATLKRLDEALRAAARDARGAITCQALRLLSEATNQRSLEDLLDLSPGYLSKVKHGQEVPSAVLAGLLGLLAARPGRLRELEQVWSAQGVSVRWTGSITVTGADRAPGAIPDLVEAA